MITLRSLAVALGGKIAGRQVLAPGPHHSPRDRSLAVQPCAAALDGFVVHSHAGDDWRLCRDYVKERLGLPLGRPTAELTKEERAEFAARRREAEQAEAADRARRQAAAVQLWRERREPRGTLAERYLNSRGLDLGLEIANAVLGFHPEVTWQQADGTLARSPAMICAMRGIHSDELQAVHLTLLDGEGRKLGRKMRGVARGAVIKLDPEEAVSYGLTLGEGVETVLSARVLGLRPAWAAGSVGGIAAFPVLPGIEALTLLEENDDSGASARAVQHCAERWDAAVREVDVIKPAIGNDLNDALKRIAA